jgi:hypothetical protein
MILRKLTKKSQIKFGKHADLTVQQLLDLKKGPYLVWMYFCCSAIDFFPDILDELYIKEEQRISKPGKISDEEFDKIMHSRVVAYIMHSPNPAIAGHNLKYKHKAIKRGEYVRSQKKDNSQFSLGKMAWKNHGH